MRPTDEALIAQNQPITIDKNWTLFLDRDGVINRRIVGDYIKRVEELELLPGVLDFLSAVQSDFQHIVVVTNQQGIGKGIMSHEDLHLVHQHLTEQVNAHGGQIDAIYYAPQLSAENHPDRKPGPGMAMQAKEQFPAIDFSRSIMVGDSPSDIEFGRRLGMKTAFVLTNEVASRPEADLYLDQLAALKEYLR